MTELYSPLIKLLSNLTIHYNDGLANISQPIMALTLLRNKLLLGRSAVYTCLFKFALGTRFFECQTQLCVEKLTDMASGGRVTLTLTRWALTMSDRWVGIWAGVAAFYGHPASLPQQCNAALHLNLLNLASLSLPNMLIVAHIDNLLITRRFDIFRTHLANWMLVIHNIWWWSKKCPGIAYLVVV